MLGFFKRKRIEGYERAARNYVLYTYKPELPVLPKKYADNLKKLWGNPDGDVQFSISADSEVSSGHHDKKDSGIKYSDREKVQYSLSDDDDTDIPNRGDRFVPDSVRILLREGADTPSLNRLSSHLDKCLNLTFVDMLIRYINQKGWRDSRVYKAANLDRRLFSKMMSDRNYKPSKDTALAVVIGLELTFAQASDMLSRAGYTLSHSNKRDVIIEYFIREGVHNLSDINEVLYRLDQKIIGK